MPLSEAVREELRAELESLKTQKKAIDEKVDAIKKILSPVEVLAVQYGPQITPNNSSVSNSLAGFGLRKALQVVLAKHSKGLKPREAADLVEKLGYTTSGKTSVKAMVGNELWRMAKVGLVQKTSASRYRLTDSGKGA